MIVRPWNRLALLTASLATAVAGAGCNGETAPPTIHDGGGTGGSSEGPDGGGSSGAGGGTGTHDASSTGFGTPDRPTFEAIGPIDHPPPPPPNMDSTSVITGQRARLIGTHFTACTNMPKSTADRWCAFTLPNSQIGLTDLWVMNVTKALAGTPPKCDGKDPNCVLLVPPGSSPTMGTQLWTGAPMNGPSFPTTDRFDGDTLIFHALASENLDPYAGPIFAWKPGWPAPKQISVGKAAYSCSAHPSADVFVCIEDLSTMDPLTFNLTGGTLANGGKVIKQIIPFRMGTNTSQWRANLSNDGSTLVFSTGGLTLNDRETLYTVKLANPAMVTQVGTPGISRWTISPDEKKFYYLRNYNYDTSGAPAGTMTMADFPGGTNEVTLAPMVGAIIPLSDPTGMIDKGLAYFDNVLASKANFEVMANTTSKTVVTVVKNIGGALGISDDLKLLYYYKDVNMDNMTTTDGYIAKMDGSDVASGGCTITDQLNADIYGAPFSANGSQLFWADNIDPVDGVGEGWTANPNGCTGKHKFSDKMDFWFLHGNDGMVYSDQGEADYSTLNYVLFTGGTSLGTPVVVQKQVARIYGILPDFNSVIYNIVNATPEMDGLYSYAKIPFKGPIAGM